MRRFSRSTEDWLLLIVAVATDESGTSSPAPPRTRDSPSGGGSRRTASRQRAETRGVAPHGVGIAHADRNGAIQRAEAGRRRAQPAGADLRGDVARRQPD